MRKRKVLKKVLVVNTSARRCGVDVVCLRTLELFSKDADFSFITRNKSDFEKEVAGRKATYFSFGGNLFYEAWLFYRILRREQPDIVHIHTARDYQLTLFKRCFPRILFIVTRHNSLALASLPNRFFLKSADHIVTVSNDSRDAFLERFPDLSSRTRTIHHGMEIGKKIPFPSFQRFRLAYLGRISETKGLHTLVEALALLKKILPKISFELLIGGFFEKKMYESRIHELIGKYKLEANVTFSGEVRDSRAFLKESHVLVQPAPLSARESFGLVALEAMSAGRPVVSFACGALPELIQNGRTGLIAPGESPDSLAKTLAQLAVQPALVKKMGAAGNALARRLFSIKAFRAKMAGLYQID